MEKQVCLISLCDGVCTISHRILDHEFNECRKCSLPLHSITMPPTHVHVDTLDSCDPSLSVSWKEPLVDYICPVDITHYKVSCNSANDAVSKMVSDSVLSTELPVIAGEKYLCSVESVSHIGKSRKIYGRPVTYR